MKHVVEVVTWASMARGATYAARCSCGWVGATREATPRAATQEAAIHDDRAGLQSPPLGGRASPGDTA